MDLDDEGSWVDEVDMSGFVLSEDVRAEVAEAARRAAERMRSGV